jgi:hypothetical protein
MGRRKISILSTTVGYLYSAGSGGIDLERPRQAVDPVASAWPPSCFQVRGWRRPPPVISKRYEAGWFQMGC